MTDSLDAFLDEALPQDDLVGGDGPNDYWVTDLPTATTAMGRVANIDAQISEIVDTANDRIDRINKWRNDECERLKQRRGYYEALLSHFHVAVLKADPKRKTVKLDNGVLTARKQPDNIAIPEPTLVTVWLMKNNPRYLKHVDPELDRMVVKAAVLQNGEVIPGVEIVPGVVTFNASPH